MPSVSHDQKSHVAPRFNHLDLRNAVVPLIILSTSYDTDANVISVTLTKGIQWHHLQFCQHCMTKSHIAPHVNHLDLRNAMLSLTMLSISHDSDADANGIT